MESGGQKKEFSHTCHSRHTSDPQNGEKCFAFPTGNDTRLLPQQEEEKITLRPVTAQPIGDCHNSANEKLLNCQFPPMDQWTLCLQGPSQVPNRVFFFLSLDLHVVHH